MKLTGKYIICLVLFAITTIDFSCKKDLLKVVSVTAGTFTDTRDGKVYNTTTIDSYTWLAQNLDYRVDSSFYYNFDSLSYKDYGRLYTWNAALAAIPPGWHLPTYSELNFLNYNLGGDYAGSQMIQPDNHWEMPDYNDNNYSKLSIIPGGIYAAQTHNFNYIGRNAYFWEAGRMEWGVDFQDHFYFGFDYDAKNPGAMLSVRCVKDY